MLSRPVHEFAHPATQLEKIYTKNYQTKDAFQAGLIAGGASIAGAHWLDVWKVQRQTKGANFSLIKGISPAIVSQSMRTGVTYCGFDSLKGFFKSYGLTGFGWEFIAASLGAAIGETITNPMTVIKNAAIKQQEIPTRQIPGYLYQRNGMGAFTKGIVPAMLRKSLSNGGLLSASPYCVGWVMSAFTFCDQDAAKSSTYKTASKLLGGGFAGAVMEVLTLPLDKWKVYNQAVINPATGRTYSSLEAAKLVYQEGYTAMFAGGFSAFSRKFGIKAIQYYVLLEAVEMLRNRSLVKIDTKLSAEEAQDEAAAADAASKPIAAAVAAAKV